MESIQDRYIKIADRLKGERTTNLFATNDEIAIDKKTGKEIPRKWFLCEVESADYKSVKRGLSQDELSASIYYSKPTIVKWEKGQGDNRIPDTEQLLSLSAFYQCDIGYLLCFYDERTIDYPATQSFLGLNSEAVATVRKANVVNKAHYIKGFDIKSEIDTGTLAIDDLEAEKVEKQIIKLGLINYFITNCDDIVTAIRSIEKAKETHQALRSYKHIKEIRNIFNKVYYTDKSGYKKWLLFSEQTSTFFPPSKGKTAKIQQQDFLYTVWQQLVDEAEQRTENQYRYSINQSFNRIIDVLLSGKPASEDK